MKPKLLAIFLLIVLVPLAIVGWLGVRVSRAEKETVANRFHEVLLGKLQDANLLIAGVLEQRQRELLTQPPLGLLPTGNIRERAAQFPGVRQFFVLGSDGRLLYPSRLASCTAAEEDFLGRTQQIWANGEIPYAPRPGGKSQVQEGSSAVLQSKGWHSWYSGTGLDLIFWWREAPDRTVGAEFNQARLMADIIAALPQTGADSSLHNGRIVLKDSSGDTVYQWGDHELADAETPQAILPLNPPLGSWNLDYFAPADALASGLGQGTTFNMIVALCGLAVAVMALAIYYYRENARAMREASQRITFVNQVSHELKTPLTNIRMYAELLEEKMIDPDEKDRHYLDVIVAESQRLSRLIGNILTFSRKHRNKLVLHPAPGDIDEFLQTVIAHFRVALEAKGLRVTFNGDAGHEAVFDHDALEQIVGNLLNNVEKYAASGDQVTVTTSQDGDVVAVRVADNGPGIPARERERIFEPFYRVSSRLTDGVAGTGIGLAIARDLARLHGGDLTFEPTAQGASFKVTLYAQQT